MAKESYPTPAELDAKVADIPYEEARSKLVEIVTRLEQGNIPLEESLALWELGEALARRCEAWLDSARARLAATQASTRTASAPTKDDDAESAGN